MKLLAGLISGHMVTSSAALMAGKVAALMAGLGAALMAGSENSQR
jgi:hypothetical protein